MAFLVHFSHLLANPAPFHPPLISQVPGPVSQLLDPACFLYVLLLQNGIDNVLACTLVFICQEGIVKHNKSILQCAYRCTGVYTYTYTCAMWLEWHPRLRATVEDLALRPWNWFQIHCKFLWGCLSCQLTLCGLCAGLTAKPQPNAQMDNRIFC